MGEDGAGHDRVLDGGEDAQAAATAGASENKSPCASAASRCIHGLSPTVADVVDSRPFIPSAHRWPHS